MTAEGILSITV